jgi:hypothetical protein
MSRMDETEQEISPDKFSGDWLTASVRTMKVLSQETSNSKYDSFPGLLAKVSAFTHLLLLCETDDPDLIRRCVIRVISQFLETTNFDFFPVFRPRTFKLFARNAVGFTLERFTIRKSMPRVWLYHRCCEALRDLGGEQKPLMAERRLDLASFPKVEIPETKMTSSDGCVLKEITRNVRYIPGGKCPRCCRPAFLKWMGFPEEEVGAALEESRSTIRRLFEECKPESKSDTLDQRPPSLTTGQRENPESTRTPRA